MELLGEDDVTGHDDVHPGQVLRAIVSPVQLLDGQVMTRDVHPGPRHRVLCEPGGRPLVQAPLQQLGGRLLVYCVACQVEPRVEIQGIDDIMMKIRHGQMCHLDSLHRCQPKLSKSRSYKRRNEDN